MGGFVEINNAFEEIPPGNHSPKKIEEKCNEHEKSNAMASESS